LNFQLVIFPSAIAPWIMIRLITLGICLVVFIDATNSIPLHEEGDAANSVPLQEEGLDKRIHGAVESETMEKSSMILRNMIGPMSDPEEVHEMGKRKDWGCYKLRCWKYCGSAGAWCYTSIRDECLYDTDGQCGPRFLRRECTGSCGIGKK